MKPINSLLILIAFASMASATTPKPTPSPTPDPSAWSIFLAFEPPFAGHAAPAVSPAPTPVPRPALAPAAPSSPQTHVLTVGEYYLLTYATYQIEIENERKDAVFRNRPVNQGYIDRLTFASQIQLQYRDRSILTHSADALWTGGLPDMP